MTSCRIEFYINKALFHILDFWNAISLPFTWVREGVEKDNFLAKLNFKIHKMNGGWKKNFLLYKTAYLAQS